MAALRHLARWFTWHLREPAPTTSHGGSLSMQSSARITIFSSTERS